MIYLLKWNRKQKFINYQKVQVDTILKWVLELFMSLRRNCLAHATVQEKKRVNFEFRTRRNIL